MLSFEIIKTVQVCINIKTTFVELIGNTIILWIIELIFLFINEKYQLYNVTDNVSSVLSLIHTNCCV